MMAVNGRRISCVAAMAKNRGIGKDGVLPWRIKSELKHFTKVTTAVKNKEKQNAVLMGRKTWESIPERHRPLPGRLNIILSKTMSSPPDDVLVCSDLQQALDILSNPPYSDTIETIFIAGGYSLYKESITSPLIHRIYLTHVYLDVVCDVFFPEFDDNKFDIISLPEIPTGIQEENGIKFQYFVYERKNEL